MIRNTELHTPAIRRRAALAGALMLSLIAPTSRADSPVPPQVQSAVDRGLDWLSTHQNARTGGWSGGGGSDDQTAAITSLGVMAFLARGHVPGQGPYGDVLLRTVDSVIALQLDNGMLAKTVGQHSMYDHGISTVMLCEVYGMLDDQRQQKALIAIAKAVNLILRAQAVRKDPDSQGGWRYDPAANDSDISVTGWQLMALRGAANVGANVPRSAIQAGVAYILRRANPDGGFSYTGPGPSNTPRTGTGILALELLGQHQNRAALAGGDYLRTHPITDDGSTFYYYGVYYCAQAAWQLGGDYWRDIDGPLNKALLQKQSADGGWPVTPSESSAGNAYSTAMAILALTVPYRYLPIYQR